MNGLPPAGVPRIRPRIHRHCPANHCRRRIPAASGRSRPYSVTPGKTEMIHFSISVNNDCEFTGMPTIKIERPPTYGTIQVEQRIDFARLAQNGAPASCADKRFPAFPYNTPRTRISSARMSSGSKSQRERNAQTSGYPLPSGISTHRLAVPTRRSPAFPYNIPPNKNIVGEDVVRFEVTTGTERTDFRVPITIGHIEEDDDSDDD